MSAGVVAGRCSWGRFQEWLEPALALEVVEIVAADDMALADPDLRHGAPAALLHHLGAPRRLEVDAHLVDLHAFLDQQSLGRLAERTGGGAVHQHLRRHFSTGKPACCQPARPPERLATRVKPWRLSTLAALPARSPPSQ